MSPFVANVLTVVRERFGRARQNTRPYIEITGVHAGSGSSAVMRIAISQPLADDAPILEPHCTTGPRTGQCRVIHLHGMELLHRGWRQRIDDYSVVLSRGPADLTISLVDGESGSTVLRQEFPARQIDALLREFRAQSCNAYDDTNYADWAKRRNATRAIAQAEQDDTSDSLFSLVVPVESAIGDPFFDTLASIAQQRGCRWEAIVAASEDVYDEAAALVASLGDARVRMAGSTAPAHRAHIIETGLRAADGDFAAVVMPGDTLDAQCLLHISQFAATGNYDFIYCDEDSWDATRRRVERPLFKPDWNRDFLYARNYIGSFAFASAALLRTLAPGFLSIDDAWDYELALRVSEEAHSIGHVPEVLYHRRAKASKAQVHDANCGSLDALREHFARRGLAAKVEQDDFGLFHTCFEPGDDHPLVSIIIPNKDHIGYLAPCLDSIGENAGYDRYEIVIVENNSTDLKTFAFYEHATTRDKRIRVVFFEGEFNYSKVVNFGAGHARGNLLLLLNNDTRAITPGFLRKMAGYFTRPEVGVVGPRLLYEDGLVQHAGLFLYGDGRLGFANQNLPADGFGYLGNLAGAWDCPAVLGACQMVRTATFWQAEGYCEDLAITCNDLDFCWRVREMGLEVAYTPDVQFVHNEYGSRGSDLADEGRKAQSIREGELLRKRWPFLFDRGDCFINPNLDQSSPYFRLDHADAEEMRNRAQ